MLHRSLSMPGWVLSRTSHDNTLAAGKTLHNRLVRVTSTYPPTQNELNALRRAPNRSVWWAHVWRSLPQCVGGRPCDAWLAARSAQGDVGGHRPRDANDPVGCGTGRCLSVAPRGAARLSTTTHGEPPLAGWAMMHADGVMSAATARQHRFGE